jgi:predicted Zn-dependent peptidase
MPTIVAAACQGGGDRRQPFGPASSTIDTMPIDPTAADADTHVATLANGVRVLTLEAPQLRTAHVSVFVHTGSQHESGRQHGISHMVEHMAFKGTHARSCQRINLDAEQLGAEVNAHTDKDHCAFHMVGHARDAQAFVAMLGDIVRNSSFPPDELERERQVILHELTEDDEDPMATAFKLFDQRCFGTHALSRSVIGTRTNIGRFQREELLDYTRRQFTGHNVIVGVVGPLHAGRVTDWARSAFGDMPAGQPNRVAPPRWLGGVAARRLGGCPQTHLVLGFPIPPLGGAHAPGVLAAALFGEGMSSPLMDELRERRALVYYAACSADISELSGQFVIEASTAPENVDAFFAQVLRLLRAHADAIDPVALQRARNQLAVRELRTQESASRRLEAAALDLCFLGRVRARGERSAALQDLQAAQLRDTFAALLGAPAAAALAGKLRAGATERVRALLAQAAG